METRRVILQPTRQIGHQATQRSGAAFQASTAETEVRVEPVRRTNAQPERRSSEGMANAAALRLGIAAQLLVSHEADRASEMVLPTHPAMRMAARYASTAEGLAQANTLGFSRTV